ncbi:NADPH-dependent FMN reductase [Chondrocystis sp. NIES-4102]|nr:NADPH-dependent FMN reductase [Chondrocystis sp. NIES-4102]
MVYVVAIAGSPSYPSKSYAILEYATKILQQQKIQTEIISIRDLTPEDLIFGQYDSPTFEPTKAIVANANALIIATPIYKAAYTGLLKAFLDLLPQKAFSGKVILPLATGGSLAHLLSVDYALKPVLSELGARYILGTIYLVDKQIQLQANGEVQLNEDSDQRLKAALQELVAVSNGLPAISQELVKTT